MVKYDHLRFLPRHLAYPEEENERNTMNAGKWVKALWRRSTPSMGLFEKNDPIFGLCELKEEEEEEEEEALVIPGHLWGCPPPAGNPAGSYTHYQRNTSQNY